MGQELRQVLEHDAEMFATHAQSFLAMYPESGKLWKETFEWSNVSPEDAGVIAYTLAVSVLFRLLEADGPAPRAEPEVEHPHPAVRSNLVISKGLALAHDADVITLEDLRDLRRLLEQSAIQVEKIWSRFGLPGRRLGPSSDWASQVSDLGGELIEKQRQYTDLLKSHARLPRTWHASWPKVD